MTRPDYATTIAVDSVEELDSIMSLPPEYVAMYDVEHAPRLFFEKLSVYLEVYHTEDSCIGDASVYRFAGADGNSKES